MLGLNFRNLTATTPENCVIGVGTTPPQYRVFGTDKTADILNSDAQNGWYLFSVFIQGDAEIKKGVQIKDGNFAMTCSGGQIENFNVVGQVIKNGTVSSEFLFSKSYNYADVAEIALLFLIAATFIWFLIFKIIKRRSYV